MNRTMLKGAAATALLILLATSGAQADTFRKCGFKVMVTANGMTPVEVPDARFTAWARTRGDSASARDTANLATNDVAARCVRAAFAGDLAQVPQACAFNAGVHNANYYGFGVSGFNLTRARRVLKQTVCNAPRPATTIKEATDTITRQGFRAWIQKTDGTGRCPEAAIFGPPRELRLACKGHGTDNDPAGRWFMFPR